MSVLSGLKGPALEAAGFTPLPCSGWVLPTKRLWRDRFQKPCGRVRARVAAAAHHGETAVLHIGHHAVGEQIPPAAQPQRREFFSAKLNELVKCSMAMAVQLARWGPLSGAQRFRGAVLVRSARGWHAAARRCRRSGSWPPAWGWDWQWPPSVPVPRCPPRRPPDRERWSPTVWIALMAVLQELPMNFSIGTAPARPGSLHGGIGFPLLEFRGAADGGGSIQ